MMPTNPETPREPVPSPNWYVAENGAAIAYRDAEGRIVGEADPESHADEAPPPPCGLCNRRVPVPAPGRTLCPDCAFFPLD